jgi:hypothetical protein
VDDMQAVLVKRMLTEPERERALMWQRGASRSAQVAVAGQASAQTSQLQ